MKKSTYLTIIILLAIIILPALWGFSRSAGTSSTGSLNKGLVGHWDMDQTSLKSSTVLADRTPNANNGTLVGSPTFTTDRNNQSNKAMSYSGSGQYINSGDPTNGSLDFGSGNFTLSAWVKTNTLNSAYHCVITKNANSYPNYQLCINASNVFQAGYEVSVGNISRALSGSLSTNTWYNTVVVADRTNGTSLYLNGILIQTVSAKSGSLDNVANLLIGRHVGGSALDWNGSIDDVRIYNRALSSTEITRLYGSYNPKTSTGSLQKGLVSDWSLDQTSLKTALYKDNSPTSTDMTAVAAPTSATDQRGQSAKALTFDGASQYLTNTTADFRSADSAGSMSAWIKWTGSAQSAVFSSADTATADYYFKWNILGSANNYVIYIAQKNNDTADEIKGSTPLNDSLWHLATVTSSGSAWKLYIDGVAETITLVAGANSGDWFADTPNRDNLNIGVTKTSAIGSYFNGTIADYKIWNRELSATEVATLYRMYNPKTSTGSLKKGLVGQWDMAQTSLMSSTVIKDKTPGSYNGTYTGTMTAAVDRHNQSNKSIDFDGSTNYMTISNFYNNLSITGNWSVSAWFKFDSVSSNQALFSSSASSSNRMQIYFNDGLDILSGSIYNGSVITSKSVSFTDTTSWHHTVFTNTNTTTTAYLDNILLTDTTQSMNAEATATTIVGASQAAAAKFSGKISDIKVYNRVLSTTEVAALYNSY